jgi:hypothetical protein
MTVIELEEDLRGHEEALRRRQRLWRKRLVDDREMLREWRALAKKAQRSIAQLEARIARHQQWLGRFG